ncbi:peroxisomal membrane protein PEX14-like [Zingiber officinale]|uniref:peroxisomal membrane protein PEX14-like n=1 Tax=Zingiber officinale TaxID=94328 RepID=UPI001C4AD2C8|nr:peroxisomal membrane protein PEX14-like [Zingiber officinale]
MDRPDQTSASPMAPQSQSPPQNPPTPGSETKIPINGGTNAKIDAANETSEAPVLREDQVQNAINFLSHPKVRSSPVVHRRSFLEKKGLTKEEIDEAFRRVPDPSSNATNGQVYTTNTASQPKSLNTLQPQDPVQTPQPAGPPITVASASPSQQPRRFHLSHALVAAGVVAASGFGSAVLVKNVFIPRLKAWIKKVVAEEKESEEGSLSTKLAEEAAEAAKAAAASAAVVAKASQELLSSKSEERKYFEGFMAALDVQVKEMKSMGDAIRRLESTRDDRFSEDKPIYENIMHTTGNGTANNTWRTSQRVKVNSPPITSYGEVRSSPPPMLRESLTAANRNSYTEPWEVARSAQQRPSYSLQHETSEERLGSRIDDGYGPPPDRNVNGYDTSEPWWSKKNVRITEMETEEQQKQLHYGVESNERLKPRGWVPPQPPAIVMPGAADAIRRPKPLPQKQPTGDAQSVASSDDGKEGETRVPDSVTEADLNNTIPAGSSSQSGIQEESATALEVI